MVASSCPEFLQGITIVGTLEDALADTEGEKGHVRTLEKARSCVVT